MSSVDSGSRVDAFLDASLQTAKTRAFPACRSQQNQAWGALSQDSVTTQLTSKSPRGTFRKYASNKSLMCCLFAVPEEELAELPLATGGCDPAGRAPCFLYSSAAWLYSS